MQDGVASLFIIDGSSYIFRAFHASPPLSTREGQPTNGLLVFTKMLLSLVREHGAVSLAVVFDAPGPTFRHERFAGYKATRTSPPAELIAQFPFFREIVAALGVPSYEVKGYEADDVMATLTRQAQARGVQVTLVTGDKDLLQLVKDGQVRMMDTMSRPARIFTEAEVLARFGVGPAQVVDVLALAGDTSDNVPGAKGVGEKTAGRLVADFGSMEGVLANLDQVSGKVRRQNLAEFAPLAPLSKELVTLLFDAPVTLRLEGMAPKWALLEQLFGRLEFHRLLQEVEAVVGRRQPAVDRVVAPPEPSAAAPAPVVVASPVQGGQVVYDAAALAQIVAAIGAAGAFSLYVISETASPVAGELVGLALAWGEGVTAYIPCAHRTLCAPSQLPAAQVLEALRPLLEAPHIERRCHGAKLCWQHFLRWGLELGGLAFDTELASYLLEPDHSRHDLAPLSEAYLHLRTLSQEQVLGKGKALMRWSMLEIESVAEAAQQWAARVQVLTPLLRARLAAQDLLPVLEDLELPLALVLARMEVRGIYVDKAELASISDVLLQEMRRLEAEAQVLVPHPFNINSPKQLAEVLYEKLGLKPGRKKRTTHGYSTDQESLEAMVDQHPLPELVVAYRHVAKLRSTYAEALAALIDPRTERVHTRFNQTVAATGRLSSSDPNLQNIPVRSAQGRTIRRAFKARPGHRFVAADYSQIELRVMAHFSEDERLIEAFSLGQDVHQRTAAEIFGVPLAEVDKAQRNVGKTINFGVLYGMGVQRLAREIKVSVREAKSFIERFETRFAGVRDYFADLVAEATARGYVTTLLGRRRPIPQLASSRQVEVALGKRLAINTPIQGTAADLIKVAMLRIEPVLREQGLAAQMLLQVHDEVLFEVPAEEVEAVARLLRYEMEHVHALRVPLVVDLSCGAVWSEMARMPG